MSSYTLTDGASDTVTVRPSAFPSHGALLTVKEAGTEAAVYVGPGVAVSFASEVLKAAGVDAAIVLAGDDTVAAPEPDIEPAKACAPCLPTGYHREHALQLALNHLQPLNAEEAIAEANVLATYLEGN